MKLTMLIVATACTITRALPSSFNDKWVPDITSPKYGDVWKVGERRAVTWNVSGAPADLTNGPGFLWLQSRSPPQFYVLTGEIDILSGRKIVTVPNVNAGEDYSIKLFGQASADSSLFKIEKAS